MSFLKAEWRKLAIANYEVEQSLLLPYLPAHTELDCWEGTCYVSLVGFMFLNTKLKGLKIPFHTNFEEVNLRFYVKYKDKINQKWKRGVVFIKEIVPKPALTWVANTIYKEHYQTMPMKHCWNENDREKKVSYQWKCKGKWQRLEVVAEKALYPIIKNSEAEFITEHYWGYSRLNDSKTVEYQVTHPHWEQYQVKKFDIKVDFAWVYGTTLGSLNQTQPKSVMLIEGSDVSVESKKILTS
ncbi:MAG: DUF2071 domain-containing protein [Raineya sp.]